MIGVWAMTMFWIGLRIGESRWESGRGTEVFVSFVFITSFNFQNSPVGWGMVFSFYRRENRLRAEATRSHTAIK